MRFLLACLLGLVLGACQAPADQADAAPTRPNIVIILADDMGYSDIGCYGGEIRTPVLDRLAADGLRFSQFYNTARCCPTRASLLTGHYPHQVGVGYMMGDEKVPGYRGDLRQDHPTIAEVLKAAGYGTYQAGKWHVTRHQREPDSAYNWPHNRGFDQAYGLIQGAASFYDTTVMYENGQPAGPFDQDYYFTDAITTKAIDYLGAHETEAADRPFFLYLAYTAPHWPLHAPEETIATYEGAYDAGWDTIRQARYQRMVEMGIIPAGTELPPRYEAAEAWEEVEHPAWQARRMEVYAAQVSRMDQNIGRLVDFLAEKGELDHTLIFFLADNGGCAETLDPASDWYVNCCAGIGPSGRPLQPGNDPAVMPGPDYTYQSYGPAWAQVSNTPFRMYKHWNQEGGVRTPLVVHYPAGMRQQGGWSASPGHLIDLMATCVEVAGAKYPASFGGGNPKPLPGQNLLPVLQGENLPERTIFFEHQGNRGLRAGKWKLVSVSDPNPGAFRRTDSIALDQWRLYDLNQDPTELYDLSDQEPKRLQQFIDRWYAWAHDNRVLPKPGK